MHALNLRKEYTNMKIQITQHNETYTIESSDEDISCSEMLDYAHNLLLAAGYHRDSVKEAFYDKADELGSEEGVCMQPNPSGAPAREVLSSFDDLSFLEDYATEIKSRYGDSRYFYRSDADTLVYKFFDTENVGQNANSDNTLYSIDPSGGPFISQGTNLQQYISEKLPNRVVESMCFDKSKNAFVLNLVK